MQRREFLKSTGLGLTSLAVIGLDSAARGDDASKKQASELAVRQTATDRFELTFRPREPRSMRILQITDTHFGSPEAEYQRRDERSYEVIRKLVADERIDFVAHTGDFVNNDRGRKVTWGAVDFMDSLGVPWTHALGNHDIGAVPVDEFRAKSKVGSFGHFEHEGGRQYAFRLDVHGSGENPQFSFFVFDSGFKNPLKFVAAPQRAWFARQMETDRASQVTCPAIALIHIPVVEFERLRSSGQFSGIYGETVCCETDSGQTFRSLNESQRVKAIFSGHDHENDYRGVWEGMELVYGRVSGYSGYGDLARGGRVIELDLERGTYHHRLVAPTA